MNKLIIVAISLLLYLSCLILLLFIIGLMGCFAFIINEKEIICCCCVNKLVNDFSKNNDKNNEKNDEKNDEIIVVINPDNSTDLGFIH